MSSENSDIEIQSALPTKKQKMPKSPTEEVLADNNKKTTKMMIHEALTELKTRKGVSTYAIKKFIIEKYKVNAEKINSLVNKQLKSGVEDGSILQTKGIGATGSFKLVPVKDKPKKPKKPKQGADKKKTTTEKKKTDMQKDKPKGEKKKTIEKAVKSKTKAVEKSKSKAGENSKPVPKKTKQVAIDEKKKAKVVQTPAKKRAMMMKRKSIGSIIKPPKMKPKAK